MPNTIEKVNQTNGFIPVNNGSADITRGAFMKRGPTPGTNNGMAIVASGTSAVPDVLGQMVAPLDYSVEGETLLNGTDFVVKEVTWVHPFRIFRLRYDTDSDIDATQAVSTTTITLTSLEDNIDAAFLYVVSGTGAGQTNYLTASASGSATLKAAFGTDLDTSSDLIKILPRFHQLIGLTSDGTELSSQAAAGAITAMVMDTWMDRSGRLERMSPVDHAALTGLNSLDSIQFYSDIAFIDAGPYSIS